MRLCGMVGMAQMLAAKEMGYDACPMDGFDFNAVGNLIHLPGDHVISFMLAMGKGGEDPWPRGGQLPLQEVIITDRF